MDNRHPRILRPSSHLAPRLSRCHCNRQRLSGREAPTKDDLTITEEKRPQGILPLEAPETDVSCREPDSRRSCGEGSRDDLCPRSPQLLLRGHRALRRKPLDKRLNTARNIKFALATYVLLGLVLSGFTNKKKWVPPPTSPRDRHEGLQGQHAGHRERPSAIGT